MAFNPLNLFKRDRNRTMATQSADTVAAAVRAFEAAKSTRMFNEYATGISAIDYDIRQGMRVLRARARHAEQNNAYVRKFLTALANNTVGAQGFGTTFKALQPDGRVDVLDSRTLASGWKDWTRVGNCEVTATMSFRQFQRLVITMLARDGEVFVQKRYGKQFPHGFALQLLEPELVDETFNDNRGQTFIRAGIEYNLDGRPVAYHVSDYDPRMDISGGALSPMSVNAVRKVIPAKNMIHIFTRISALQTRGFSWFAPILISSHTLNAYIKAHLQAAYAGATFGGVLTQKNDGQPVGSITGDTKTEDGRIEMNIEPGTVLVAPKGYEYTERNPRFPVQAFGDFLKSSLMEIAAGLNIDYQLLSGDFSNASWSSGRLAMDQTREVFKSLQQDLIDQLLDPVYNEWLKTALLTRTLPLPDSKFAKFSAAITWVPRSFLYLNPVDQARADQINISVGLDSRTHILAERGQEVDNTLAQLADEDKRADALGIDITGSAKTESLSTSTTSTATESVAQTEDEQQQLKQKGSSNGAR